MDEQNAELWPVAKFYFEVEFDGDLGSISFQEVSGLDHETEVIEYRHGDSPEFSKKKRAGMVKWPNIVMKKGIFEEDSRLTEYFMAIYEDKNFYHDADTRVDFTINLLNEQAEPVMTWNVVRAIPVKLSGTDLKSEGNEVAVETIEWAHEGLLTEFA
jgi:phage tail-like protein